MGCAVSLLALTIPATVIAQTPGPDIGAFLPGEMDQEHTPSRWTIADFENNTDHDLDIFLWYEYWTFLGTEGDFLRGVASRDKVIELAWEPINIPEGSPCHDPADGHNDTVVSLEAMADPEHPFYSCYEDEYMRVWAQSLRDDLTDRETGEHYSVIFRPMSEMNDPGVDWGTNNPTNSYFKDAWRHMHDIFVDEGATCTTEEEVNGTCPSSKNVKWLWAPNRSFTAGTGLGDTDPTTAYYTYNHYYPGDEYVNYLGIDGYTLGCDYGLWQELDKVFGPSYDVFTFLSPSKEVMIAETGAPDYVWEPASCNDRNFSLNKPDWIKRAFTSWMPYRFPKVTRATWFDDGSDEEPFIDYRINSDYPGTSNTVAFKSAMQSLYDRSYFMNWYDNVGGTNWMLAANPGPVNGGAQAVTSHLSVASSPRDDWPSEIADNTTNITSFASLSGGPVRLTTEQLDPASHTSSRAVVSQRTLWPRLAPPYGNSLEEVTGRDYVSLSEPEPSLHHKGLSGHNYFPWYDHQSQGMQDWLVISNMNPFEIYYEIRFPGVTCAVSGACGTIAAGGSAYPTFPGRAGGPVEIQTWVSDINPSTQQQQKLAPAFSVPSQRVLFNYYNDNNIVDFTEITAIPAEELSDRYVWTHYDQQSQTPNYATDQVVVVNPDPDHTVYYRIKINGQVKASGPIGPAGNVKPTFPGVTGGPVEVQAWSDQVGGTTPAKVLASQRVFWHYNCAFEEVPGLPASTTGGVDQLRSSYYWTWYDSLDYLQNKDWLLVANPNAGSVSYTIKIGGDQVAAGSIPSGGRVTPEFQGMRGGPVEVTATGPVITSQRVLWKGSYVVPYFNEVWGTPTDL
jgi:hypothetical protein